MVTTDGSQTITHAKNFTSASMQHNGHLYYNAYDSQGQHYPHFRDGTASNGVDINWRQYYGSNYKTHQWTSDSSGNMAQIFQGRIEAVGELKGTSLDINGDGDVSGTLTVGTISATNYGLASGDIPNNAANTSGNAATATTASTANNLQGFDDRDMAPEDLSYSDDLKLFFSAKEGLEDGTSTGSDWHDVLVLNSYSDSSGGNANVLAFDKNSMKIRHYQAGLSASNWGTAKELAYTASPTFTGTPAAPTASAGTNTTQIATTAFVGTAVSNLVDSAPGTLNTLNELAAALGDDASFSTTTATALGNRVRVDTASQGLSNDQKSNARTNIGAQVAGSYAASSHNHAATEITSGTLPDARLSDNVFVTRSETVGTTSDWDDFTKQGTYGVASGSGAQFTGDNRPITSGGIEPDYRYGHLVVTEDSDGQGIQQTYYPHSGNRVMFRTGWNNGSWTNWSLIWTDRTDGSGSGLDADLLDGQHASAFSTATGVADNADVTPSWVPSSDPGYFKQGSYSAGYTGDMDSLTGFRIIRSTSGSNRAFSGHHNVITLPNTGASQYGAQLAFETGTVADGGIKFRSSTNGTFTSWYRLYHEGHLPTLAELGAQAAGSYAAASHNHAASDIDSGTFADARISASSVTQHVTSFPGFGTSSGTALEGDTALFDGAYGSLSGTPTIPSGNQIIDWTSENAGTIHSSNISFPSDSNTFRTVEVDTNGNGSANNTLGASETLRFKKGSNVTLSESAGVITISSTNTTYSSSDFTHDDLTGFVADEHIDWTTDQGSTNIHSGNYINTTYSVGDGGLTQNNFTNTLKSKLDGIAAGADVTPSWVPSSDPGYGTSNFDGAYSSLTGISSASTFAGTAAEADKWSSTRQITLSGDVTGNVFFDGSSNFSITTTVVNDSHSHSNYITSNANDNVSGHTEWQDGYEARFGNSADMSIYHSSGNNYIDSNIGNLYIRANVDGDIGSNVYIRPHDNEEGIVIEDDAGVKLYYNNSQKMNTTSGGISVTGSVSASSTIGNKGTNIGQQMEYGSSSVATLRCDADRWRVYFGGGGQSREAFSIKETGDVGIGDSTPSYKLDVNGTIRATGDVIAYSDERVKENIKTIDNSLEKVNKLRGVEFNKIGEDKKSIGVIAQEIEKILPEVVKTDDEGMKSVAYGNVVGVLIEAVKELTKEVEDLKKCNKCKNCNCND
jgi:hypothetical protein